MSDTHDLRTAKVRVERVFRYLQEMHQVRTPPVGISIIGGWRLQGEP